jgi:hypothetical protein
VKRTYREAYDNLFTTKDGLDHLIIIRHLVTLLRTGEGWTLAEIMQYVSRSLGGEPCDAWLTLNALEHLWMRGELRSVAEQFGRGGTFIERWVRT